MLLTTMSLNCVVSYLASSSAKNRLSPTATPRNKSSPQLNRRRLILSLSEPEMLAP